MIGGDLAAACLSGLCLAACVLLLFAEWRKRSRMRLATKSLASLAFVGVGAVNFASGSTNPAHIALLIGLCFGAAGDVALALPEQRWFTRGLVAFLCGHLAYVLAFSTWTPPRAWLQPRAVVPLLLVVLCMAWLWRRLGRRRWVVSVYAVISGTLVTGALATLFAAPGGVAAAGALLFVFSDLAVARQRFVAPSFWNKLWGLPCYYAAQLLIAWEMAAR